MDFSTDLVAALAERCIAYEHDAWDALRAEAWPILKSALD
jgi:hypothetical protein